MKSRRMTYRTRWVKLVDFVIGSVGWCLVNGLAWVLLAQAEGTSRRILAAILFAANLLIMASLDSARRWISVGMLAAMAVNLAAALALGLGHYGVTLIPVFLHPWLRF